MWEFIKVKGFHCKRRRLASFGERACREGFGIEAFEEKHRNIHNFGRRESRLPEQRDGDTVDYRSLLHRDGSVLSAISLQVHRTISQHQRMVLPLHLAVQCEGRRQVAVVET